MENSIKSALKSARRRKVVAATGNQSVEMTPMPGASLPLVVEPGVDGSDLITWVSGNRDLLNARLHQHGALLFRGFPLHTAEDFKNLTQAMSPERLDYRYRSTPRTELGDKIYTSTEYPADQTIPLHNENAYSRRWPLKLWFFCAIAAEEGGATPIADSRKIFAAIDPSIRQKFAEKGVMYVRNYGRGLDLPWQEVFQTSDKSEVEAYCRDAQIEIEWMPDGEPRTRQRCQGTAKHPVTGEEVWFNQAHLFHISSIPSELRELMLEDFAEDELPRNAFYGDGSPIEDATLDAIRAAFESAKVAFPWRQGDALLVDNMLAAHGRQPYKGDRKILVSMAEGFEYKA